MLYSPECMRSLTSFPAVLTIIIMCTTATSLTSCSPASAAKKQRRSSKQSVRRITLLPTILMWAQDSMHKEPMFRPTYICTYWVPWVRFTARFGAGSACSETCFLMLSPFPSPTTAVQGTEPGTFKAAFENGSEAAAFGRDAAMLLTMCRHVEAGLGFSCSATFKVTVHFPWLFISLSPSLDPLVRTYCFPLFAGIRPSHTQLVCSHTIHRSNLCSLISPAPLYAPIPFSV